MSVDQAKINRVWLEADVLRALNAATGWLTTGQVASACGHAEELVRTALARLAALGEVKGGQRKRSGPLFWRLPQ
jgi:DNA-binding transcriptional regulator PaaX